MTAPLTAEQRAEALAELTGWSPVEGRDAICKSFRFLDFTRAWGFMTRVALRANVLDHHPEWFNAYGRVDITLTTRDAGGVTEKDITLARYIDRAAMG